MNTIAEDRLAAVEAACRDEVVAREVAATLARPLWTIPASWWAAETAFFMSDWMKRFGGAA